MQKYLFVNIDKCTGCRICENWCSFSKTGECGPGYSRVRVYPMESEGINVPIICNHCKEAYCMAVCPSGALTRHNETGAVIFDENICIGCRACIVACPFGAIFLDINGKILKCDLCNGEPTCATHCPVDAIVFERSELLTVPKQKLNSQKMAKSLISESRVSNAELTLSGDLGFE